jgi:hypothetical protein
LAARGGAEERCVASERYLAIVGISEEDTAHLRLLLRMVVGQLENRWRWGSEENADLVIVDPSELAGQIARNRAFSSGRRCAVFSEGEPLRDGELRLNHPPKAENLAAVLNGSTSTAVAFNTPVLQQKDDFYGVDNLGPAFEFDDEETASVSSHQREDTPAPGLDEFLKPDESSRKPQFAVPGQLADDTLIEYTGTSKRGDRRLADTVEGFRKPGKAEGINMSAAVPVTRGAPAPDQGKHALRDYLYGNLLGGPATFSLPGAPSLTLDPKEKVFHAGGHLDALTVYCKEPLQLSGWKRVTTAELGQVRTSHRPQPYERLNWLFALVRSDGRLPSHLDPGGRYKLKSWSKIERENPNYLRIASAMASEPAKLNEIATASGAPMADVFAVVSAYDAIGMIEVERRLPRHTEPAAPSGLLSRLRKPFGKS